MLHIVAVVGCQAIPSRLPNSPGPCPCCPMRRTNFPSEENAIIAGPCESATYIAPRSSTARDTIRPKTSGPAPVARPILSSSLISKTSTGFSWLSLLLLSHVPTAIPTTASTSQPLIVPQPRTTENYCNSILPSIPWERFARAQAFVSEAQRGQTVGRTVRLHVLGSLDTLFQWSRETAPGLSSPGRLPEEGHRQALLQQNGPASKEPRRLRMEGHASVRQLP